MSDAASGGAGFDPALVRALLERIERPVALCDAEGSLLLVNSHFRHALLGLGVDPLDLHLDGADLVDAQGRIVPLALMRSDLEGSALSGRQWQLLELPGPLLDPVRLEPILRDRSTAAASPPGASPSHHLAAPLGLAIDQQRLDLRYQPIVDMASGRIEAVEVLCRWRDPRLGTISPRDFIAAAEASEQIHQLGDWLVERVFAQIRQWRQRRLGLDYVSINISPLQLHGEGLLETLCQGLRRHALSASGIMLEMTENQAFDTSPGVRRRLWSLHELGFTLAMDDYGTGYSSMQRLNSLPFRALKVDRCLIEAIETDPLQQAMLRGVMELQQATGLHVVVEGVERAAQRSRLLEIGCRAGQGFLFSRPITAGELEARLLARPELNRPSC